MLLYMKKLKGVDEAKCWRKSVAGTPSVLGDCELRLVDSVFFSYASRMAGMRDVQFQAEYRVYELLEPPTEGFAIVKPHLHSVRSQYPEACRVVNLRTGVESQLCRNQEEAREVLQHVVEGTCLGSFN